MQFVKRKEGPTGWVGLLYAPRNERGLVAASSRASRTFHPGQTRIHPSATHKGRADCGEIDRDSRKNRSVPYPLVLCSCNLQHRPPPQRSQPRHQGSAQLRCQSEELLSCVREAGDYIWGRAALEPLIEEGPRRYQWSPCWVGMSHGNLTDIVPLIALSNQVGLCPCRFLKRENLRCSGSVEQACPGPDGWEGLWDSRLSSGTLSSKGELLGILRILPHAAGFGAASTTLPSRKTGASLPTQVPSPGRPALPRSLPPAAPAAGPAQPLL